MNSTKVTIVALAMIFVFAAAAKAEDPVVFSDVNLKAAVEARLGIPNPTPTQMLSLTYLDATGEEGKEIVLLGGIEYATNLDLLELDNNKISDISPLAGLTKLRHLDLIADKSGNSNQVEDITPLAGLINLEVLKMNRNLVSNIGPLSGLTKLWKLELNNNLISDISSLEGLTNLTHLELNANQIPGISALANLKSLIFLSLRDNQISDISYLSDLTNLTTLFLAGNQISGISDLSGLTNLTDLDLWENQVSDISPLYDEITGEGLTKLTDLNLGYNQISDISVLSNMPLMMNLKLQGNQIVDIGPVAGLTNLVKLELNNNQVNAISALSGLTNLEILTLHHNQLNDLIPLSGATDLVDLRIGSNQISDVSPLQYLTNMRLLRLQDNQITDISPLESLTNLTLLKLEGNPGSWDAYCVSAPIIMFNNPGINFTSDPNPYDCDFPPAPTDPGTEVVVIPTDSTTGAEPVTLVFEEVTASGGTSLTTSGTGPTPPSGFQLGDPPTYYELTTTASYNGTIYVCISYSSITFEGPPEALRLFHYENGQWIDHTDVVNTEDGTICGLVSSLSPFAIFLDEALVPPVFESLSATPSILWPPNHKMVAIEVTWVVRDNLHENPSVALASIVMNEGEETNTYDPSFDDTQGDGHTTDDIQVNNGGIYLRAERSGTGTGRIYTLTFNATDSDGNVGTAAVTVTVPHEAP